MFWATDCVHFPQARCFSSCTASGNAVRCFGQPQVGAFSLPAFQDADIAHSITHKVALSTLNHNHQWSIPKTVVEYTTDLVEISAEFRHSRHLVFSLKSFILPHCVVEDNGNLRQCFQAVSLLVLLCSPERAFYSEPCIIHAPRIARKICLRKPKNSKFWRFSNMIFLTVGLVYASKDHPFSSFWLLKLLFSHFLFLLLFYPTSGVDSKAEKKKKMNGRGKDEKPLPGISHW